MTVNKVETFEFINFSLLPKKASESQESKIKKTRDKFSEYDFCFEQTAESLTCDYFGIKCGTDRETILFPVEVFWCMTENLGYAIYSGDIFYIESPVIAADLTAKYHEINQMAFVSWVNSDSKKGCRPIEEAKEHQKKVSH